MKKLVVLTGAGISAESGIKTFRDSGGLWEEHDIMEVATPEGWHKNTSLVLKFYNERRKQVLEALPNAAHFALVELEKKYEVHIITQNIDDLHERAGSKNILHLHGEIKKSRSSDDPKLIYQLNGEEIKIGDLCEKGSQLRPHIVWFGEEVPNMEMAYQLVSQAAVFIIIGTSLNVYPAAGLINHAPESAPIFLVDPHAKSIDYIKNLTTIRENASKGVPELVQQLIESTN